MRRWLFSSAVAFVAAIVVAIIFLVWGQKWFLPGPDKAIVYLLILVPLAFASSITLFKIMRSYASYKGTYQNHTLELGGPVVVFALLIGTGYYFYQHPPPKDHNNLVIHFQNIDEPTKKLTGTATVSYQYDIRSYDVFDGTINYPEAEPGRSIFIAYDLSGIKHADSFIVPLSNNALLVKVHMNASMSEEKKVLVGKLLTRLNIYYTNAQNFASFLEEDMVYVFNGDQKYWDDLNHRVDAYSAARDALYAIKDSLTNALQSFLGTKTQDLTELFNDFIEGHKTYFKSFNDAYRNDLIKFSTDGLGKKEQNKIIEAAKKTGRLAQNWLSGFQVRINNVKQLLSTT